jgi:glutamate-1-semialdehyde 2,1-aminomutase
VRDTIVLPYNDLEAVEAAFKSHPQQIAAIIVEPIAGNMGVVPPAPGFLAGLRDLCTANGALLIFDEVISGFRAALGGAGQLYDITPDLCCFGKIIGGGFPVGCIAGRRDIMESFAPVGPVYQAGTLSGNPVAMVAGLATLDALAAPGFYDALEQKGALLEALLNKAIAEAGVTALVQRAGSLLTLFFTDKPVRNWADAASCDTEAFSRYFAKMLEAGFLIAPSQYEAIFISAAHSEEDLQAFARAARAALV